MSEQSDPKRRETGHYWVTFNSGGGKDILHWDGLHWSSVSNTFRIPDNALNGQVDERRLTHEDKQRIAELEFELRRLIYGYRVSGIESLKSEEWKYIYDKAEAKLNGKPKP